MSGSDTQWQCTGCLKASLDEFIIGFALAGPVGQLTDL